MAMKGKWAQGIKPRNFAWVIQDKLAVCERPGGYGQNHRRVRRQEEIIWIREQGFTRVVSLIPSPHNLHNYDEHGVAWLHRPFGPADDPVEVLRDLYPRIDELTEGDGRILIHRDELGDIVAGVVAGYLAWTGLIKEQPRVVTAVERLLHRQLGPEGRELVTVAGELAAER
ncbi:MAG TPA: hypothetical protein VMW08_12785 [Acidimicrobiales bacterium]|nr:hypothetical protein [Acidimicrobiales bacterium]